MKFDGLWFCVSFSQCHFSPAFVKFSICEAVSMVMGVSVLCGVEKPRCVPLLCSDTTDGFCSLYPVYPFKETAAEHEGDAKPEFSELPRASESV